MKYSIIIPIGNTYGTLINTTEIKVYFASNIEIIAKAISKNPRTLRVSGRKRAYLIYENVELKTKR